MTANVMVVGSVNMDMVWRVAAMPLRGETVMSTTFNMVPGGKGANQAVAAARMGARVGLVGCVGDDGLGVTLRAGLTAEGIDERHLRTVQGVASGVAGIQVDAEGQNSIVVGPNANTALTVADVDHAAAALRGADVMLCQLEVPLAVVTHAASIAVAAGVKVVLNPSPYQSLPSALLSCVAALIVNEGEASRLSDRVVVDLDSAKLTARQLRSMGLPLVVLTMGEKGVCVAQGDAAVHLPAIQVEVVDTTAAGDTFAGAFAVLWAEGLSVIDAVQAAQHAAALAVTRMGAQPSIPHRQQVEAFQRASN